jgi:HSP20 family molecular chaperone IbpA
MKKNSLAALPAARFFGVGLILAVSIASLAGAPPGLDADKKEKPPGFVERIKRWQDQIWNKLRAPSKARQEPRDDLALSNPASPKGGVLKPNVDDEWERDLFARMDKMQEEMDRVFADSFHGFGLTPELARSLDLGRSDQSFDIRDEGDHYLVQAHLSELNMNKVKVSAEGQTLKIEVKSQETGKNGNAGTFSREQAYSEQIVELPGPVKSQKIKVDKKGGMLVITLPKA